VTYIIITDAGIGDETPPRIVIASPPFVPAVRISVSKVKVVQNVVLGRNYVLEASQDAASWSPALPPFNAASENSSVLFPGCLLQRRAPEAAGVLRSARSKVLEILFHDGLQRWRRRQAQGY
jgi:hypothetical protein